MVCVDPNRVSSTLDIHSPLSKSLHHCEQLLVIDRVVEFGRGKLAAVETDGVQGAVKGGLRQDAPNLIPDCDIYAATYKLYIK